MQGGQEVQARGAPSTAPRLHPALLPRRGTHRPAGRADCCAGILGVAASAPRTGLWSEGLAGRLGGSASGENGCELSARAVPSSSWVPTPPGVRGGTDTPPPAQAPGSPRSFLGEAGSRAGVVLAGGGLSFQLCPAASSPVPTGLCSQSIPGGGAGGGGAGLWHRRPD